MKQLSVKTLICIHNASGDTVGKGFFYISVHLSRQKFDVKIIVYYKNPQQKQPVQLAVLLSTY